MELRLDPSIIKTKLELGYGGKVHAFFTSTCALHIDKYVPFDTGALANTTIINGSIVNYGNVDADSITYNQEYASYVYDGVDLNFQTDKHLLATHHWDEAMWSAEQQDIEEEVQRYVDKIGDIE